MHIAVVFSVCFFVMTGGATGQVKYVWDLLKPPMDIMKIADLLASAVPGVTYPIHNDIPTTAFSCGKPGFYADEEAQCQLFHRCDLNGNMTSYLCVNTTVFNQIDLICDYWFNVDCGRSKEFVDFANSRLYTDKQLFDTPPADYVPPSDTSSSSAGAPKSMPVKSAAPAPGKSAPPPPAKPAAKPAAAAATTTTAATTEAPADTAATDAPAGDTDAPTDATDAPTDAATDAPAETEAPTTTVAPTTTTTKKAAATTPPKKIAVAGKASSGSKG